MKHYLPKSLRALFLSLTLLLSLPMLADKVEIDGINYELDAETNQATVIKKKSSSRYSGEIIIPESVRYEGIIYSVTSIGDDAFNACLNLTSVTIPNSVTNIGRGAFYGCSSITSVTIPNSVTRIEDFLFYRCSSLISLTIPNSVMSIGGYALSRCSSLTSVAIPNSVTSIKFYAFRECTGLTSITIPNSVTSIGIGVFENCSNLKVVRCLAEKVPYTSKYAFKDFRTENVTLNVPATSIESYKVAEQWRSFGKIVAITAGESGTEALNAKTESSATYNLSGGRVQNAQKGIYIKNGKKVTVK